jgi:hypothetical protein
LGIGGEFPRFVALLQATGDEMKRVLEILADVRIVTAEIGGTLTLVFLIVYGTYKAWKEFVAKVFRGGR